MIAIHLANRHYPSDEAYLRAIGETTRAEYEAIAAAGLVVQIDAPDLAMGRHVGHRPLDAGEFRDHVAPRVDVLDEATRRVPPERLRLHLCWGNYQGPHRHDAELRDVLDLLLRSRPGAPVFEAAKARHEHAWRVFEEVAVPDDKALTPGVIGTCTNYVQHPELVAERIARLAGLVGRERVVAGTDCGFARFASFVTVDPDAAWMKLACLVQGAAIASRRLW